MRRPQLRRLVGVTLLVACGSGRAHVGEDGGVVDLAGVARLTIPRGALGNSLEPEVEVTLERTSSRPLDAGTDVDERAVLISPASLRFSPPAMIQLPAPPELESMDRALFHLAAGEVVWKRIPASLCGFFDESLCGELESGGIVKTGYEPEAGCGDTPLVLPLAMVLLLL